MPRLRLPELVPDLAHGQTEKTIGAYLQQCRPGGVVATRETHVGALRFMLTAIDDIATSMTTCPHEAM